MAVGRDSTVLHVSAISTYQIQYYFIGFIPSAPFKFMKISAFVSNFSFRSS